MSHIAQESQKLSPSGIISLFTLDTTSIGGPVLNLVMGSQSTKAVTYGGVTFQPIDVKFSGLQTTGQGALPTPKISVGNTDGLMQALLNTFGDLNGCTLHRIRTYVRFLDGQPDADPEAFYGPDTFRIERKSVEDPNHIEWDLSAALDQEGKQIPGRVVIRGTCLWRYRQLKKDGSGFDYSKAQCPYTGSKFFDINDQPVTDRSEDAPSRRLNCCKVRFGKNKPLPFGGFPGVGRVNS